MNKKIVCASALLVAFATAGCSGEAQPPAGEAIDASTPKAASTPLGAPAPAATSTDVTLADVEFAYRCRGLLSSASASSRVLPAGETPAELSQISMRHITWWTGEASRRDNALGISKDQRRALLAGSTRVKPTRESLEEALPAIRECLTQVPQ